VTHELAVQRAPAWLTALTLALAAARSPLAQAAAAACLVGSALPLLSVPELLLWRVGRRLLLGPDSAELMMLAWVSWWLLVLLGWWLPVVLGRWQVTGAERAWLAGLALPVFPPDRTARWVHRQAPAGPSPVCDQDSAHQVSKARPQQEHQRHWALLLQASLPPWSRRCLGELYVSLWLARAAPQHAATPGT